MCFCIIDDKINLPKDMGSWEQFVYQFVARSRSMGGDLAPNLGRTKKIFRGPISGKISIFRVKISDDLFLVIDLVLRIFPFFSHIFRMFTMLNVVYDHFLTRKTQLFTLFVLSRTSNNTTSQNIGGGTNAWILGGTVPPVPLRSPPLSRRKELSLTIISIINYFFNNFSKPL